MTPSTCYLCSSKSSDVFLFSSLHVVICTRHHFLQLCAVLGYPPLYLRQEGERRLSHLSPAISGLSLTHIQTDPYYYGDIYRFLIQSHYSLHINNVCIYIIYVWQLFPPVFHLSLPLFMVSFAKEDLSFSAWPWGSAKKDPAFSKTIKVISPLFSWSIFRWLVQCPPNSYWMFPSPHSSQHDL